jgi:hypothetical protein
MPAPTLDRNPRTSIQAGTSAGHRRRRKQLVVAASALVVLAVAFGTSLAIATRPDAPQATADPGAAQVAAAGDQNVNAGQGSTAQPGQDAQAGTATKPDTSSKSDSNPAPAGGGGSASAALSDGTHDAYITRIDRANDRIVVDVVQVFQGDRAVEAATADGRPRSEAQYLSTWVRNQNPRLRTLPLASGVVVKLWGSCEESSKDRDAAFNALAEHARQRATYYYTLTVSHGKVQRIQEQLAINAC